MTKTASARKPRRGGRAGAGPGAGGRGVRGMYTIQNVLGLHARAAATFVKVANRFRSDITVRRETASVNGKSIMGVLMLAAANGTQIEICADGPDAEDAVTALGQLIGERFGEK